MQISRAGITGCSDSYMFNVSESDGPFSTLPASPPAACVSSGGFALLPRVGIVIFKKL